MAQVSGGTSFDQVAERKHYLVASILSRASDLWAKNGKDAPSPDSIIPVLLHIFLSRWSQFGAQREETLSLETWLTRVSTAEQEVHALMPALTPAAIAEVISLLQTELSFAAGQWALGNPEQPPTAHVLNAVEHVLFSHKCIARPPNSKLPKTVGDSSHAL